MLRTSAEIRKEIEERFGFFPPFFDPAVKTPEVLDSLWEQTLSAYVNNPLPALFKEKLFAYLSRYCTVPYCIVCHSCALRPLGMTAREVLDLLDHPANIMEEDIETKMSTVVGETKPLATWPAPGSTLEDILLQCSIAVFLKPGNAERYQNDIRLLIGEVNYNHLSSFLSYVKMCHFWVETHPEISYETDKRAKDNLAPLLKEDPALGDFFHNYGAKVRREREKREELLVGEITELKTLKEALQKAHTQLEKRVEERTTELLKLNKLLKSEIEQRKRVEVILKESEEKYRNLFETAQVGIFRSKLDGSAFLDLNKKFAEIVGYTREELLGTPSKIRWANPKEREKMVEIITKQGFLTDFEAQALTKSGEIKTVLVSFRLYPGEGYLEGTLVDVTDRKRVAEALRESETKFRLVTQSANDAIISASSDGKITSWNKGAQVMFGFSEPEIIGKSITKIIPERYRADHQHGFKRFSSTAEPQMIGKTVELLGLNKNKTEFPVELSLSHWKAKGDQFYTAIIRDITTRKEVEEEIQRYRKHLEVLVEERTKNLKSVNKNLSQEIIERKQAEEFLRQSEERFRKIFEEGQLSMSMVDANDQFIKVNASMCRMLGYSEEELTGLTWKDITHQDDITSGVKNMIKLLNGEIPYYKTEKRYLKKNRELLWGSLVVSVIRGKNGKIIYRLAMIDDITERKLAEQEISKNRKELRQLSTQLLNAQEDERKRISQELHDELSQLLTAVSINLEELKENIQASLSPRLSECLKETIALINQTDERIHELSFELRPLILDELGLISTIRWYVDKYTKRLGVDVKFEVKDLFRRLPKAVETALFRIMQEAMTNITRYAEADTISIMLSLHNNIIFMSIKDNGRGFDIKKIQKRDIMNRGIGIIGMQERVIQLGGKWNIQSNPGEGTQIKVEIPLRNLS